MRGWMSCAMDAVVYSEYCGDGCNKVLTVSLVRNGRGMQSPALVSHFLFCGRCSGRSFFPNERLGWELPDRVSVSEVEDR
jgi:hypothetical protein